MRAARRKEIAASVAMGVLCVAVALVWSYPLVLDPACEVVLPGGAHGEAHASSLGIWARHDQFLSIFGVAHNARSLIEGHPSKIIDHGLCYPTPNAAFLGEHMIESGFLGLPAYALTGDPIVAYNAVCLLTILIASLTMFWLVRYWTASAGAGAVAGILFAFSPARIDDLAHLAVQGTHWIPLVLLAFEHFLDRARLRDALALAGAALLACLTGSYPLMVLTMFVVPFGLARLVARRADLDTRRLGLLSMSILVVGATVAIILWPYAEGQQTWLLLRKRMVLFNSYRNFLPGHAAGTGVLSLALACLLLVRDRRGRVAHLAARLGKPWIRRPRTSPSPALALLIATLVSLVMCTEGALWPGGPQVPALYGVLSRHVDFLSYVRAPAALRSGVFLGLAVLAGLGAARLLNRLPVRVGQATTVLLVAAALAEIFWPSVARHTYGKVQTAHLRSACPSTETLVAYEGLTDERLDGPILDLPFHDDAKHGLAEELPLYVLLAAYHGRPSAACYNSYKPPSQANVARIAGRLGSNRGLVELAALGLRNLVVHLHMSTSLALQPLIARAAKDVGDALHDVPTPEGDDGTGGVGLKLVRRTATATVLRVTGSPLTHDDVSKLMPRGIDDLRDIRRGPSQSWIHVDVVNTSDQTWKLPNPIRPVRAEIRYTAVGSSEAAPWQVRTMMLPLALAPGATDALPIGLAPFPPSGRYQIDVRVPELGWSLSPARIVRVH